MVYNLCRCGTYGRAPKLSGGGPHSIPKAPDQLSGHSSCTFWSIIPLISPLYIYLLETRQILKHALIADPPWFKSKRLDGCGVFGISRKRLTQQASPQANGHTLQEALHIIYLNDLIVVTRIGDVRISV